MTQRTKTLSRPYSIQPTFDSRVVGEPYTVEVRENGRRLSLRQMPDPFHNTTVRPRGWRVALGVLLRRYEVSVHVGAPRQLVEDVMELDDNYKGDRGSKRRAEWDAGFQQALGDFAARAGEHSELTSVTVGGGVFAHDVLVHTLEGHMEARPGD
jgi:hypothetical protein